MRLINGKYLLYFAGAYYHKRRKGYTIRLASMRIAQMGSTLCDVSALESEDQQVRRQSHLVQVQSPISTAPTDLLNNVPIAWLDL